MSIETNINGKNFNISAFCKYLPKVELHAHLNGSLNEDVLKELGCSNASISEYQKLTTIFNKTNRTLEECFDLFNIAHNATNTKEKLYLATKSVIEDFNNDNTVYLELRTTPRSEEGMTKEEYIETVIAAINDCKNLNILVKLILSINRNESKDLTESNLDLILKFKDKYPNTIKGIDLSGNPQIGNFDNNLFEKARKYGLKTAIHCAEVKNDEEVNQILNFVPDRIGHGVFLHPSNGGNQKNWELYCQKIIPIECCLTSNVVCGTVKRYEDHHIQELINLKLPFSICTDDKGVFCTTLSKEYEYVMKTFKLSPKELFRCSINAMEQSFASDEEKKVVIQNITEYLQKWEDSTPIVKDNTHDLIECER